MGWGERAGKRSPAPSRLGPARSFQSRGRRRSRSRRRGGEAGAGPERAGSRRAPGTGRPLPPGLGPRTGPGAAGGARGAPGLAPKQRWGGSGLSPRTPSEGHLWVLGAAHPPDIGKGSGQASWAGLSECCRDWDRLGPQVRGNGTLPKPVRGSPHSSSFLWWDVGLDVSPSALLYLGERCPNAWSCPSGLTHDLLLHPSLQTPGGDGDSCGDITNPVLDPSVGWWPRGFSLTTNSGAAGPGLGSSTLGPSGDRGDVQPWTL